LVNVRRRLHLGSASWIDVSADAKVTPSLHHSITPSLHHSITPSTASFMGNFAALWLAALSSASIWFIHDSYKAEFAMGIVNIDDDLHDQMRKASALSCRSINAQAAFWLKLGMLSEMNPTLSFNEIAAQQFRSVGLMPDKKVKKQ
jgi:plasmid stability protein